MQCVVCAPGSRILLIARIQSGCDTSSASPLYRGFNSEYTEHFYTNNYSEMSACIAEGEFVSEGNEGLVFPVQVTSTVPLYQAFNAKAVARYYTTDRDDMDKVISTQGYALEGIAGYVYATQICGSIPLYHLQLPGRDNFYTTNETEREQATHDGYVDMGVACYVLPNL